MSETTSAPEDHLHTAATDPDLHHGDAAPGDDLAFTPGEAEGAASRLAGMPRLPAPPAEPTRRSGVSEVAGVPRAEDHLHATDTDPDLRHADAGAVDDLAFTPEQAAGAAGRLDPSVSG